VVVVPKGGGALLERIVAGQALAGDEPVVGVAVVAGGDACAVDVDDGADVGNILAAAVEAVVDREKVLVREAVDPFDPEGFAYAGLDEGGESGCFAVRTHEIGVDPQAARGDIAMDLGVDLLHADTELVRAGWPGAGGYRKRIDEGLKL
jgi:hypothetical protein